MKKRYLITFVTTIEATSVGAAKLAVTRLGLRIPGKPYVHLKERQGKERAWERCAMGPWKRWRKT